MELKQEKSQLQMQKWAKSVHVMRIDQEIEASHARAARRHGSVPCSITAS